MFLGGGLKSRSKTHLSFAMSRKPSSSSSGPVVTEGTRCGITRPWPLGFIKEIEKSILKEAFQRHFKDCRVHILASIASCVQLPDTHTLTDVAAVNHPSSAEAVELCCCALTQDPITSHVQQPGPAAGAGHS